jgi:hypothetical protein
MQETENVKNTISSSLKEKIITKNAGQQSPQSRGEVAAQEQFRSIQEAIGSEALSSLDYHEIEEKWQLRNK